MQNLKYSLLYRFLIIVSLTTKYYVLNNYVCNNQIFHSRLVTVLIFMNTGVLLDCVCGTDLNPGHEPESSKLR